jgi:hypothetical protein
MKESTNMSTVRDKFVLVKLFLMRNLSAIFLSGLLTAAGVCVMHYVGMMAMECDAVIEWNYGVIAASVLVAIAVSCIGYWILFRLLSLYPAEEKLRVVSALVITLAVCAVHYIGMAAATYEYSPGKITAAQDHPGMRSTVSAAAANRVALLVNIIFNYIVSMACQGELRSSYYRLLKFEGLLRQTSSDPQYQGDSFIKKYHKYSREYMKDMRRVMADRKGSCCKSEFLDRSSSKIFDMYDDIQQGVSDSESGHSVSKSSRVGAEPSVTPSAGNTHMEMSAKEEEQELPV